jgi:hypothetical protein
MFDLREYAVCPLGACWPPAECQILGPDDLPVAVAREEPWPEVLTRPWPDGLKGRPWLWRLLGLGLPARQSRTVVRLLEDGRPVLRLHRRRPVFWDTVGVFDGADRRVGYCKGSFKSALGADFKILDAGHATVGAVGEAGDGAYHVGGPGAAGELGTLGFRGRGRCRVSVATGCSAQEGGLFLLAAALVLVSLRAALGGAEDGG